MWFLPVMEPGLGCLSSGAHGNQASNGSDSAKELQAGRCMTQVMQPATPAAIPK